jgi:tRNA wybutosine-synthesizing protein 2
MAEPTMAAIVERPRTETAIASLRAEGVYDDARSIQPHGDDRIAIPVSGAPTHTAVLDVVETAGERRLTTLEDHLRERGWSGEDLADAPSSWAVLGTVILVDLQGVPNREAVGEALLALHGEADTVLARGGVAGPGRGPTPEVVAGEGDTETVHVEHGTTYAMDLDRVMFSPGNKAERARMGDVVGNDERVLDAFAGIGYFALPMARAGAQVTAVERNSVAFEYLLENAVGNGVTDRIHAYRGDNREVVPDLGGDFDRIVMGHYDAHESLDAVLPALAGGGRLHLHEATPSDLVPDRPVDRLEAAAESAGRAVSVDDVRRVKGYSEGVDHVVVDADVD